MHFGNTFCFILVCPSGVVGPTCGGIANLQCKPGYTCEGVAPFPDASGICCRNDAIGKKHLAKPWSSQILTLELSLRMNINELCICFGRLTLTKRFST